MLYYPLLAGVYLFESTPATFVSVLSTMMTVDLFLPLTTILQSGLPVFDLYIITSGQALCLEPDQSGDAPDDWLGDAPSADAAPFAVLGIGDCLGEAAFVFRFVQPFSVRACTILRTLGLSRDGWKAVVASRPDFAGCMRSAIAQRVLRLAAEREKRDGGAYSPWPAMAALVCQELEKEGPMASPMRGPAPAGTDVG